MNAKCDHKPPAGHRELKGEELEAHLKAMEARGELSRIVRRGKPSKAINDTCMHIYVKA